MTHRVRSSAMNPAKRHEIFSRLRAANPHPTTELEYTHAVRIAGGGGAVGAIHRQGRQPGHAQAVSGGQHARGHLRAGRSRAGRYIKTIGLYKSKARHLIAACRMLIEQHGSQVPADRAALEALPGVGRKTANVILNTAFGQPTMAVDTHIFRVANRIGLAPGKTVLEVEKKLLKTIPDEFRIDAHHWLILHGRYVCQARKPKCGECIIADLCEYKDKTWPAPRKRAVPANGGRKRQPKPIHVQSQPRPGSPVLLRRVGEIPRRPAAGGRGAARARRVLAHPEYHAMLDQPDRYQERDYLPESGETNPFLHLSMHLAIAEQLSVDQPPGIRDALSAPAQAAWRRDAGPACGHGLPGGNDLAGAALPDGIRFSGLFALPGSASSAQPERPSLRPLKSCGCRSSFCRNTVDKPVET